MKTLFADLKKGPKGSVSHPGSRSHTGDNDIFLHPTNPLTPPGLIHPTNPLAPPGLIAKRECV